MIASVSSRDTDCGLGTDLKDSNACWLPCNIGTHESHIVKGRQVWRRLSDEAIKEAETLDNESGDPCKCVICANRRKDSCYIRKRLNGTPEEREAFRLDFQRKENDRSTKEIPDPGVELAELARVEG